MASSGVPSWPAGRSTPANEAGGGYVPAGRGPRRRDGDREPRPVRQRSVPARGSLIAVARPRVGMDAERRDDLIDAYFTALDEGEFSLVEPHLAPDVTYESVGIDALDGPEGVRRYFEELRPFGGTVHEVERRLHAEEASAAEGRVTGEHEGESIDTGFCDVFEFDDAEEHLTRVTVYTNA